MYINYIGHQILIFHVSVSPSQSALRNTSIDTRFNVAAFGLLGYELNLNELTSVEIKAVKNQVKFYKEHRELLQYGTLYQFSFMEKSNHSEWMVMNSDHSEAIYGYYNGLQVMNPKTTCVHLSSFKENSLYSFKLRPQEHNLKEFGSMINFVLPIHMDPNGFIMTQAKIKQFNTVIKIHITALLLQDCLKRALLNNIYITSYFNFFSITSLK